MKNLHQFGRAAVFINIFSILYLGLIFPALTAIFHPHPPLQTPELFIESFHWLQTATFFLRLFSGDWFAAHLGDFEDSMLKFSHSI